MFSLLVAGIASLATSTPAMETSSDLLSFRAAAAMSGMQQGIKVRSEAAKMRWHDDRQVQQGTAQSTTPVAEPADATKPASSAYGLASCNTQAWGVISCSPTASANYGGGCTTTDGGCAWTTTQGCGNLTWPQACWYTVNSNTCIPTNAPGCQTTTKTSSSMYTCNLAAGTTCAQGCIKLTALMYECKTDTPFCTANTIANGTCTNNVCGGASYTINCLTTFSTSGCTSAGACLSNVPGCSGPTHSQGINCAGTSAGGGTGCGHKTAEAGVVVSGPNIGFGETDEPTGVKPESMISVAFLALGFVAARKLRLI